METIYKTFYSHAPRGARRDSGFTQEEVANFYSHAPRGVRRSAKGNIKREIIISTHTPLAGRDRYI